RNLVSERSRTRMGRPPKGGNVSSPARRGTPRDRHARRSRRSLRGTTGHPGGFEDDQGRLPHAAILQPRRQLLRQDENLQYDPDNPPLLQPHAESSRRKHTTPESSRAPCQERYQPHETHPGRQVHRLLPIIERASRSRIQDVDNARCQGEIEWSHLQVSNTEPSVKYLDPSSLSNR